MVTPSFGDVCRFRGPEGLWVPFAPAGARSDGSAVRADYVRCRSYPDGDMTLTLPLDACESIEFGCGTDESRSFWYAKVEDPCNDYTGPEGAATEERG